MVTRRLFLGLAASGLLPAQARAALTEPEFFKKAVAGNQLPPVNDRIPDSPRIINLRSLDRRPGQHGGDVRMLIGRQKDIRLMTINSYARLVGFDQNLDLQPDILETYESDRDRIFTLRLRKGHRWSDGSPFTAEDFRYCWEDDLSNEELNRHGPPREMLSNGLPPQFEIIDELTVRYSWESPNPGFLQNLAAPQPLVLMLPAHYMKQFHKNYQDPDKLASLIEEYRVDDWSALHTKMSRSYRPENPDLPTLDPWRNTTYLHSEQFIFERNPYYHRVDDHGQQLPYIDRWILSVNSSDIITAKAGAGDADIQVRNLDFVDYPYLKAAEKRHPINVHLWKGVQGSRIALYPNLNCKDGEWRKFLRNTDVRRALSISIDRHEINMVSFFGLATESANTVLPESPRYSEHLAKAWAHFDPDAANALLDQAGYAERDENGTRLLSDGRPIDVIVETAGESTLETDVLELISDHWQRIGIPLFIRSSQRDIFRSRAKAGETIMSIWVGYDNAVPTADMSPVELAPTGDHQLQWPLWGAHYLSNGEQGSEPDLPEAARLLSLFKAWNQSESSTERVRIWNEMLEIHAEQVFAIGTVNGTRYPVIRSSKLQNFPDAALYGFDPTSYLGVYMPDTFWYEEEQA